MARQTTNYGLTKPDYTDIADIEVVNSNMDIIDEALKVIDAKAQNVMSKNSSAWSSTVAYAVGQYCIYNNSLWKCLVQHSGQTPQEGTYWTKVSLDTLGAEISVINQNLSLIGTKYKIQNTITHADAWTVTDIGTLTVPKGIYAVELRVEASGSIASTEVEIGIANHAWNAHHLNSAFNYAQSVTAVGEFDGNIIGHIFPAENLDNINIYVTLEAYRIA